ncbi:solute carrier family 15 member 3-like [Oscarella lobularis]|uniref:solute carrier family 15 member 3-like n=1 Tax=Oscarella lobularis TaxID=121494 RepID=UPI0033133673
MNYDVDADRRPKLPLFPRRPRKKGFSCELSPGRKATILLMIVLMFERFSFYAITLNIATFSTIVLGFAQVDIGAITICTIGSAYFFAPLFGWLSDRKFGYYKILVTSFAFYIVASCLVGASGLDMILQPSYNVSTNSTSDVRYFYRPRVLYLIGLGLMVPCVSAVRANLIPYILEQLSDGSEKRRVISKLISIAYVVINVGASLSPLLGFFRDPLPKIKSKNVDVDLLWVYACVVAPIGLSIALFVLVKWRRSYRDYEATRARLDYSPNVRSILSTACGCYAENEPTYYDRSEMPYKNDADKKADRLNEHRKRLAVIVPVFGSLLIYSIVDGQMDSSFNDQLYHLQLYNDSSFRLKPNDVIYCGGNESLEATKFVVPPALVGVVNSLAVIVTVPMLWLVVYPIYERVVKTEFAMMNRILWGMIFAMFAVFCAMVVEMSRALAGLYRPTRYAYVCTQLLTSHFLTVVPYSPISIFAQVPQYAFSGVAEALSNIATMEFLLSRAPREFRCTVFSLFYFLKGIGYYLGGLLGLTASQLGLYFTSWSETNYKFVVKYFDSSRNKTWIYFLIIFVGMVISCFFFIRVKEKHKDVVRKYRQEPRKKTRRKRYASMI